MKFRTKSGSTYEVQSIGDRERVRLVTEGDTRGGKHRRPINTGEWQEVVDLKVAIGHRATFTLAFGDKGVVTNTVEEIW